MKKYEKKLIKEWCLMYYYCLAIEILVIWLISVFGFDDYSLQSLSKIMSFIVGATIAINLPTSIDYWQERWASKDEVKPNE